jgi:nucleoside-diphosphate-sugar epimerase
LNSTINHKVLLTGASGFLGQILFSNLVQNFAVYKLSRSKKSDFIFDLSNSLPTFNSNFSCIIHAAGLAHEYPKNCKEGRIFHQTNYIGTLNLLKSLEQFPPETFIFISSVSVYGLNSCELINEDYPLNGTSPYANSKIMAEKYVIDWCKERSVRCLVLRLPLVVGDNPPGNLGKMIKAIRNSRYLRIGNGDSSKSAVLGSDVASLMIKYLNDSELPGGIYNLTDGLHPTLFQIEEAIRNFYQKPPIRFISINLALLVGKIGDLIPFLPINTSSIKKLTTNLTFDDTKARKELGWSSSSVLSLFK